MRFAAPQLLERDHRVEGFDCGVTSLDKWLINHARAAAGAGSAKTYVVDDSEQARVVGYHALTVASIGHRDATERVKKGMPGHPIPAVLLARLAVDSSVQGKGLGGFLLIDAMRRCLSVSESTGVRVLLAHAINDEALTFYKRFDFETSPTDPMNVQLLIKDISTTLEVSD